MPQDPLVLYVHGSGPRNSSMSWNELVLGVAGHYMIQPLVERYGGCMMVLKVS